MNYPTLKLYEEAADERQLTVDVIVRATDDLRLEAIEAIEAYKDELKTLCEQMGHDYESFDIKEELEMG